jgi:hypothetical protein
MSKIVRTLVILAMTATLSAIARADRLPDIDIEEHCAEVGDAGRVAMCHINERFAKFWIKYHPVDIRVLYQCSGLIVSTGGGYLHLRACIISRAEADV